MDHILSGFKTSKSSLETFLGLQWILRKLGLEGGGGNDPEF